MPELEKLSISQNKPLSKIMKSKEPEIPPNPINQKQLENLMTSSLKTKMKETRGKSSQFNNTKEREEIIRKILKYQSSSRFGLYIKKELKINYSREALNKKNTGQLQSLLHRIHVNLNTRNIDKIFNNMAVTMSVGFEKVITPFFNIDGFSDNLLQNEQFWDAFERYKIEMTLPDVPPYIQMGYIITSTMLMTHQLNKHIKPSKTMAPPDMTILDDIDEIEKKEKTNLNLGKTL